MTRKRVCYRLGLGAYTAQDVVFIQLLCTTDEFPSGGEPPPDPTQHRLLWPGQKHAVNTCGIVGIGLVRIVMYAVRMRHITKTMRAHR